MTSWLTLLAVLWVATAPLPDFSLPGENNLLEEVYIGIVNGRSTVGTPYRNARPLSSLFAPPYAAIDRDATNGSD